MILDIVLYLTYAIIWLLTSPLRLLDVVTADSQFVTAITQANSYLSIPYSYLPHFLDALLYSWGIYLAIELAIFLYKGFMWIIRKIPGIN